MTRIVEHIGDVILGRSLISAETILREFRRSLLKDLTQFGMPTAFLQEFNDLSDIFARFVPLMEQNFYDSEILAWVAGAQEATKRLPPAALKILQDSGGNQPPIDVMGLLFPEDGGERIVRLPIIDRAAQRLADRGLVTRGQFDQLSATARANAFTVAHVDSEEALGQIRSALSESVREGTSLPDFEARMKGVILKTPLSPAHQETIYRTNVQTALMDAHDELASNPIVAEVFPYQEYLAIRDGRVRPEHLELEKLGLSGTSIYRRDDPMWGYFLPPWDFSCRCGVNLLTVEDAAARGVREAKQWLRTGIPPERPEWRLDRIPFRPNPDFSRRRVAVAA